MKKQLNAPFKSTSVFGEMFKILIVAHTRIMHTFVIKNTDLGGTPLLSA